MTYVATDLSGSSKTTVAPAPRMARTRTVSDQPMIATNPALTRVNGGAKTGPNNNALIAGVGVVALLALGGGTWALTHRAATPAATPAPAAAPVAASTTTESTTATPSSTSNAAVSPIAAKPVADERVATSTRSAPPAIRSLRTPVARTAAARAPDATPAPTASNLSSNLAPQPQAVTPPVITPAPEAPAVTPTTSESVPAPTTAAPTTINPTPQTVTPAAPTAPADAPSAPQPQ